MKANKSFFVAMVSLLMVMSFSATIANAAPPVKLEGTFTDVCQQVLDARQADGNTIIERKVNIDFDGDLDGRGILDEILILYKGASEDGFNHQVFFQGTVVYDGQVTLPDDTTIGALDPDGADLLLFQVNGTVHKGVSKGQFNIQGGTGDLATAHGKGSFGGEIGVAGAWEMDLHMNGKRGDANIPDTEPCVEP